MSRKGSKQIKNSDAKGYGEKMIHAPSSLLSTRRRQLKQQQKKAAMSPLNIAHMLATGEWL